MPRLSATIEATATEEISSASVARFGASGVVDSAPVSIGVTRMLACRLVDRGLPTRHEERDRDRQQRDGQDRPLAEPQDRENFLQVESALLPGEPRRTHRPNRRWRRLVWPRTLGHGPPHLAGTRTTLVIAARFPGWLVSGTNVDGTPPLYTSVAAATPSKRRRRYPFGAPPRLPDCGRTLYEGRLDGLCSGTPCPLEASLVARGGSGEWTSDRRRLLVQRRTQFRSPLFGRPRQPEVGPEASFGHRLLHPVALIA